MGATRVAIAGSSGSIGTQTLDVVRAEPDRYEVVGARRRVLGRDADRARPIEFRPELVAVADPGAARRGRSRRCRSRRSSAISASSSRGRRGGQRRRRLRRPGRSPSPRCAAGKRLALANKESLIAAGPVVQPLRRGPGRPADPRRLRARRDPPVPARRRSDIDREVAAAAAHGERRAVPRAVARRPRRGHGRPRPWPIRRGRWARRSPSTRAR